MIIRHDLWFALLLRFPGVGRTKLELVEEDVGHEVRAVPAHGDPGQPYQHFLVAGQAPVALQEAHQLDTHCRLKRSKCIAAGSQSGLEPGRD